MIPIQELAKASAHIIVSVALDKQHRRMSLAFKDSMVTMECGWSGDDIVLKVRDARGQVSEMQVVAPPRKKIIVA
ncbi:hypothetical protein LCGC14_0940180, partial [marine sediment metagenome]